MSLMIASEMRRTRHVDLIYPDAVNFRWLQSTNFNVFVTIWQIIKDLLKPQSKFTAVYFHFDQLRVSTSEAPTVTFVMLPFLIALNWSREEGEVVPRNGDPETWNRVELRHPISGKDTTPRKPLCPPPP